MKYDLEIARKMRKSAFSDNPHKSVDVSNKENENYAKTVEDCITCDYITIEMHISGNIINVILIGKACVAVTKPVSFELSSETFFSITNCFESRINQIGCKFCL
jgi:hypothetical protein